jgi:hypothetical protein
VTVIHVEGGPGPFRDTLADGYDCSDGNSSAVEPMMEARDGGPAQGDLFAAYRPEPRKSQVDPAEIRRKLLAMPICGPQRRARPGPMRRRGSTRCCFRKWRTGCRRRSASGCAPSSGPSSSASISPPDPPPCPFFSSCGLSQVEFSPPLRDARSADH